LGQCQCEIAKFQFVICSSVVQHSHTLLIRALIVDATFISFIKLILSCKEILKFVKIGFPHAKQQRTQDLA
jgi:hypothetical protein